MGWRLLTMACLCINVAYAEKVALIFGVTGQDGSYLSELLLEKGYEVHGVKRRSSSYNTSRIEHIYTDPHSNNCRFFLHYGDLVDASNIFSLIQHIMPDEIYNLGAQSHVKVSFELPEYTGNVDALGTTRILEAIQRLKNQKQIKFYQASTSELYGLVQEIPQKETTPFYPRSPYGVAKLYAYWITKNFREAYNIFACNGILFNHESPRRGETFLTRKVTRAAARISLGMQKELYVGNLEAKRDWGFAKDYVEAMWLMLQQDHPDDYVIATGTTHSVREFIEKAFQRAGITIAWQGQEENEVGINTATQKIVVRIDPRYYRPTEVDLLIGDASKAQKQLGWSPTMTFDELISLMVDEDKELAKQELLQTSRT